jgi:hypothetical protein
MTFILNFIKIIRIKPKAARTFIESIQSNPIRRICWVPFFCFSLLTHGAQPFLRSRQFYSYSRTSQHFSNSIKFLRGQTYINVTNIFVPSLWASICNPFNAGQFLQLLLRLNIISQFIMTQCKRNLTHILIFLLLLP